MTWPHINRVAVSSIVRAEWQTDDDRVIAGAVIVGRGYVAFANGGEAHAVIVLKGEDYYAVVWERETKRFVALALGSPRR